MLQVRRAHERGHADYGWLNTHHTFSFNRYHDPEYMGFRTLRVMNEDRIAPGQGFGTHPHRDMEILTYVLSGRLKHEDSMGTGSVIEAGEWQRMTAGSGITHSEFNASDTEPVHLYQIWVLPEAKGLVPEYDQRSFPATGHPGFRLVASPDGAEDSLAIHQDARFSVAELAGGESVAYSLAAGRHAWIQLVRGHVTLNGEELGEGDGAAVSDESALQFEASEDAQVLVIDMA